MSTSGWADFVTEIEGPNQAEKFQPRASVGDLSGAWMQHQNLERSAADTSQTSCLYFSAGEVTIPYIRDEGANSDRAKLRKLQPAMDRLIEAERLERVGTAHKNIQKREVCDASHQLFPYCDYKFDPADSEPNCEYGDVRFPHCVKYDKGVLENCTADSLTFPGCFYKEPEECRGNILLHVTDTIKSAFQCIGHSIAGHPACWQCFVDDAKEFDDFGDFVKKWTKAHMRNIEFRLNVKEEIDVRFQLEAVLRQDVRAMATFDWYPPFEWKVSYGVHIQTGDSSPIKITPQAWKTTMKPSGKVIEGNKEPKPKNTKPKSGKTNLAGFGGGGGGPQGLDGTPLSIELQAGVRMDVNWTLPGAHIKITEGEYIATIFPEESDKNIVIKKNTLNATVEYLYSDLHIDRPRLTGSVAIGAKLTYRVLAGLPYIDNLLDGGLLPGLKNVKNIGLGDPMTIGMRLDYSKTEFSLETAKGVDKNCQKDESQSESVQFKIVERVGATVYAQFFAYRIDTSWIGNIDKGDESTPGLYKSVALYKHCWPLPNSITGAKNGTTGLFHKIFREAQKPFAKMFEGIGDFLNRPADPEYAQEDDDQAMRDLAQGDFAIWQERMRQNLDQRIEDDEALVRERERDEL
ncbi:hypothetical protein PRZ48_005810 [Zasmidium cellare]|uniref:Uncharacterized protein n=1 Tax=Zasmidium cellare TaxID=395010 RepID=A0ABR0ELK8_ZASCE|nr:hypothetical protein PRZ48_005810 [Zasmidium cellare]